MITDKLQEELKEMGKEFNCLKGYSDDFIDLGNKIGREMECDSEIGLAWTNISDAIRLLIMGWERMEKELIILNSKINDIRESLI